MSSDWKERVSVNKTGKTSNIQSPLQSIPFFSMNLVQIEYFYEMQQEIPGFNLVSR